MATARRRGVGGGSVAAEGVGAGWHRSREIVSSSRRRTRLNSCSCAYFPEAMHAHAVARARETRQLGRPHELPMPTTRARARASAPCRLFELPDELLLCIGEHTYSQHLPDALRLSQTSKKWRALLAPVQQKAVARRLRWRVYADGDHRRVHPGGDEAPHAGAEGDAPRWCSGESLLPQTAARSSAFASRARTMSGLPPSACDASGKAGWGFNPCTGRLMTVRHDQGVLGVPAPLDLGEELAYPDHDQTHLWYDADGEQLMSSLHDVGLDDDDPELDPVGLVIEIAYRPEAGLVGSASAMVDP